MNPKKLFSSPLAKVLILAGILYLPIIWSYFQQDEWLIFNIYLFSNEVSSISSALEKTFLSFYGHYVPLTHLFTIFFVRLFQTSYFPYAILSIAGHLAVVGAFYYFALQIFKKKNLALLSAFLFSILAGHEQAVSWVITSINSQGANFFGLLSLIFAYKFYESDYNNKSKFWLSIVFLIISLLFKETTIGLFLLIPLLWFALGKKVPRLESFFVLLTGLIYALFRALLIFANNTTNISGNQINFIHVTWNAITFPYKAFVQSIIPQETLFQVGGILAKNFRSYSDMWLATRFMEFFVLAVFLIFAFYITKHIKKKKIGLQKIKLLLFFVTFVFISAPLFAVSPERSGRIVILDSRNLYFLSMGSVLFLVAYFEELSKMKKYILLSVLISVNFLVLINRLLILQNIGQERRMILSNIHEQYPNLPLKAVFYYEGEISYYGLPENIKTPPFQSGFGQTLLASYQMTENYPGEFFDENYLWDLTSQGYKEIGERGFGYYYDYDELVKAIKSGTVALESVIAFTYKDKTLTNITSDIQEKIKNIQ